MPGGGVGRWGAVVDVGVTPGAVVEEVALTMTVWWIIVVVSHPLVLMTMRVKTANALATVRATFIGCIVLFFHLSARQYYHHRDNTPSLLRCHLTI